MRRLAQLLAVLCMAGFPLVSPSGALAADECASVFIDETGKLDRDQLDPKIDKLTELGADVRVRAYQTDDESFVNVKMDALVATCPGWRSSDNARLQGRLIVFMVTPSEVLFESGTSWDDKISEDDALAINNTMLEPSDDTAIIAVGLDESINQIEGFKLSAMMVLVPLGVLLLVGLVIVLMIGRRKRRTVRAAREQAEQAMDLVADGLVRLRENQDSELGPQKYGGQASALRYDIEVLKAGLNEADARELDAKADAVKQACDDAVLKYQELQERTALAPGARPTVETYQDIERQYRAFYTEIEETEQRVADGRAFYERLNRQVSSAPTRLAELVHKQFQLRTLATELTDQGYRHETDESLNRIDAWLESSRESIGADKNGLAIHDLETAAEQIDEVSNHLKDLETVRSRLNERLIDLGTRQTAAASQLQGTETKLQDLRIRYAPACWLELGPVVGQAAGLLAEVRQRLADGEQDASMESQRWEAASSNFDAAEKLLGIIIDCNLRVEVHAARLAALESKLPDTVSELLAGIKASQTELTTMEIEREQITNIRTLAALLVTVERLNQQLADDKPDYIELAKLVEMHQATLASIMRSAQALHDDIIRERQAARDAAAARQRQRTAAARRAAQQAADAVSRITRSSSRKSTGDDSRPSKPSKPSRSTGSRRATGSRSSGNSRRASGRRK